MVYTLLSKYSNLNLVHENVKSRLQFRLESVLSGIISFYTIKLYLIRVRHDQDKVNTTKGKILGSFPKPLQCELMYGRKENKPHY